MSRVRRASALVAVVALACVAPAGADDGKPTHNLDGVHATRYSWRGSLTGTVLDRQLAAARTRPIPQDCQDGSTCSIENFGLYTPPRLASRRTGDLTLWVELGPRNLRAAIAVYDAHARTVFYQEFTSKLSGPTKFQRTFRKLPTGWYQVILYGVASADSYTAELRWLLA
ncbi:MAG: hypothetical protein LC640_05745 [Frankia sp.]|nr:hypothetical protein [Frankia sp.]